MIKRNLVPKISLAIALPITAYAVVFMTMARPAPDSFGDSVDWEIALLTVVLPIALFSVLAIGLWRAYTSKDYLWLALQLAFFPLSYLYTLLINKGNDADNPSKPNPLREPA